jgi:sugar-phosphatase
MRLSDYTAAIFDLDGTLVVSEPAWEEAKRRVLARLGVRISQDVYDAFVGRGLRGFLNEVLGSELSDSRRTELANQIGAEADILLPDLRQPVPGAAESVLRLIGAGLHVAVCSSSPRRHIVAALDQLGLSEQIGVIVSGADLPRGKPDPLPYLETLKQMRLDPKAAFAVEDALPGAKSAYAAGLMVIGIDPGLALPALSDFCRYRVTDYAGFDQLFHAEGPSAI